MNKVTKSDIKMSRKETEKQKLSNEWCQRRLMKLLQSDENKECQDCMAKSEFN